MRNMIAWLVILLPVGFLLFGTEAQFDRAFIICALMVTIIVYFLPALVAHYRCHNHTMAIFVTNLFLGWTFLGWVAALAACPDRVVRWGC
jgi:Superinfection immunity protein